MAKLSAGLLMYRYRNEELEVFLVHPGGPFWAKKDAGSWSIPKGEFSEEEEGLRAAKREFEEETGFQPPDSSFQQLTPIKQSGGKIVHAWAVEGNCDPEKLVSNTFPMEWPPKSGKIQEFPEVDRGEWFTIETAKEKIVKGQIGFFDELAELLSDMDRE